MKRPDLSRAVARARVRTTARRLAAFTTPLARPLAWRTRTFLTEPGFHVESRLRERADLSDRRSSARFDQIVALISALERSSDSRSRETNKVLVGLRIMLEEQDDEIAALRDDIRQLRARLVELETAQ
ncbi:hypothetical protein [Frondihabitans australicus]|uniref:Uncharacterized protein n=1 Tax=Frondihabitans australicus TaxID=386892 RepID=A0A495II42_9MICO|nr:hypothetical protein [Frondihabitans australicus]RKR75644.1 hypothetical protein C8E83_2792 [Frondihabitans australicus]